MQLGKYVPQRHLFAVSCALQLVGISHTIGNEKQVLDDCYGGPTLIMMKKGQEDREKEFREVVAHAEISANQPAIIERWRFVSTLCDVETVCYTDPQTGLSSNCILDTVVEVFRECGEDTGVLLYINGSYVEAKIRDLSPAK